MSTPTLGDIFKSQLTRKASSQGTNYEEKRVKARQDLLNLLAVHLSGDTQDGLHVKVNPDEIHSFIEALSDPKVKNWYEFDQVSEFEFVFWLKSLNLTDSSTGYLEG